jgi:hypothetical protein
MVKHESHLRQRSACSPARSVTSSTVVQKHVGQTMVQFVQVRQRFATSSQRGCSRLRASRPFTSIGGISICRPMCCAVFATTCSAIWISSECASLYMKERSGLLRPSLYRPAQQSNGDWLPAPPSVPGQNQRWLSALFASRRRNRFHLPVHN